MQVRDRAGVAEGGCVILGAVAGVPEAAAAALVLAARVVEEALQ
jgi:hypothetical protein